MISHVYLSDRSSNGKTFKPVQFPTQIELTLPNVNAHLFGPNARCCTPALFAYNHRSDENYQTSDCMFVDVDCPPVEDPKEWKKEAQIKVARLGYHVFAYPSYRKKLHLLIPYSRPIDDAGDCRKVVASVLLELKPSFPDLDAACSDPSRFSFEGAPVENPAEWSFEWPGSPIDVDRILASAPPVEEIRRKLRASSLSTPPETLKPALKRPSPSSPRSSYLDSLYGAAHTEGKRHASCILAGNYIVGHSSTEEEARERFFEFAGGPGGLASGGDDDVEEAEKIIEDCLGYAELGSDLNRPAPSARPSWPEASPNPPQKKSKIVAETVVEIKRLANRELRRTVHKRKESISDAVNPRLNSGQIYSVHETSPGSNPGYAVPLDADGYKSCINDLIVENSPNPEIEVAIKNMQTKQFGPDILNHDGLHLREPNTAFFANGVFRIFPDRGTFKFEGLKDGEFLENAFTWNYEKDPDPVAVKRAIEVLNFYFPKRDCEKTVLSVDAYMFLAFLASAVSRHVDDQRCLLLYGKGGNGKSSLREIIMAILGGTVMKELPSAMLLKEGDRFSAANNGIQSASLLFADDRLPTSAKINAVSMKNLISKGPVDYEVKGGGSWTEDKLFKLLIIANQPLSFTDLADDELTRKLEIVEARAQLKEKNGKMPPITEEVVKAFRSLLCAFLKMPQIPSQIPDGYPLREEWIKEGLQAEVFRSILTPCPGAYVEVVDVKALLAKAGDKNLGGKRLSDLENALRKNGYEVRKQRNGRKRVKGYVIDTKSTYYRLATNGGINTGEREGELEEADEDYAGKFREYYKSVLPLISSYDACFRGVVSGKAPVEGSEGECRYELEERGAEPEPEFEGGSDSENLFGGAAKTQDDASTLNLPAYRKEEFVEEPQGREETGGGILYDKDMDDYYAGRIDPLPAENADPDPASLPFASSRQKPEDPPEKQKPSAFSNISLSSIKPWKPLDLPEGCRDVPGEACSWIRDVGVEESGMAAVCAGRELAEKLPENYSLEEVIEDAPTGEFGEFLAKAFNNRREEEGLGLRQ